VDQEKEKSTHTLKDLSIKLRRLKELLAGQELDAEKRARMEEFRRRLEEEREKTSARITELLSRLIADQKAVVEVSGEIAPGTLIEICQEALIVSEPLKRVRFRLEKNKVISEPLV
jgi:hypothetical protein